MRKAPDGQVRGFTSHTSFDWNESMSNLNTSTLTHEALLGLVTYDALSGEFFRAVDRSARWKAGQKIGWKMASGYISVHVGGREYLAHRLAWFYVHGFWPVQFLDHIDGNRENNSIRNLREADTSINQQNLRGPRSHGTSGFLGVRKHGSGFRAGITANGVTKNLGTFRTPECAHAAYMKAKRLMHVEGSY